MERRSFLMQAAILPFVRIARGATSERGKTQRVNSEVKEFKDPDTGARVLQLTSDGSDNVHLYFTSESFFGGGSDRVVFGSNRSGQFQFYMLEIRERKLVQLTEGQHEPQQACLSPAGHLYYFDGPILRALKLDSLDDRELYRVPDGWTPHLATCTPDGKYVAFSYREKLAVSTDTGRIYSTMAETYYQHPACVIMRIQASDGQPVAVWGERMWISHVIIHPRQPNLIVFCHEGGHNVSQRMWMVDASQPTRQSQPLYPQRPGEVCVHEYFTRGGEVGFQYEVQREGRVEYFNACIRTDGTWIQQYLLPGKRPGHIQSNTANTLVVGDCGYLSPDDRDGQNFMSLMRHANGRASVRRLCRRKPGETQHSHGHPVFSLDDHWVIFNSRVGERDNIFMADVDSIGLGSTPEPAGSFSPVRTTLSYRGQSGRASGPSPSCGFRPDRSGNREVRRHAGRHPIPCSGNAPYARCAPRTLSRRMKVNAGLSHLAAEFFRSGVRLFPSSPSGAGSPHKSVRVG
jgi:oligogalacturonide lyase